MSRLVQADVKVAGDKHRVVALLLGAHDGFERPVGAHIAEVEPLVVAEGVHVADVHDIELRIGPRDPREVVLTVELGVAEGIYHEDFHWDGLRRGAYTMPHSQTGVYGVGITPVSRVIGADVTVYNWADLRNGLLHPQYRALRC